MKGSTPLGPIVAVLIIIIILLTGALYYVQREYTRLKNPPQATSTTIHITLPTTTIVATSTEQ